MIGKYFRKYFAIKTFRRHRTRAYPSGKPLLREESALFPGRDLLGCQSNSDA